MPPYDDWNKVDDEEDDELQDYSQLDSRKDVILFCIDCSPSMHEEREDPVYEDVKTCHLFAALDAAMQIQKKKVIVGPNDSVGILLFNTTRKAESSGQGSEIKKNTYLYQPIGPLNAPTIQELIQLLDEARQDLNKLKEQFPPLEGKRIPMGDVFTSCNWVLRDGAPKTATKRVFLITDEDNPHPSTGREQLATSARTTLVDLAAAGVQVEPFFISTEEKPFEISKFYSSVLLPTNLGDDDEDSDNPAVLPEAISISRIDDLLAQMRFHEVPKRSQFSMAFQLFEGFSIGIKGYGLVTEQKKGQYKYFADAGDGMEEVVSRANYIDEERETDADRTTMMFGASVGGVTAAADNDDREEREPGSRPAGGGDSAFTRTVKLGQRPFYTAEEVRKFRTLGLEPSLKLLGFKDRSELRFEDNVKHSLFIYPDEMAYAGSKRTFSALLKSMIKKDKIGIVLALTRRNASPTFCAMLPQAEQTDDAGWTDPAGFHLIPLPFADDIRAATVETAHRASDDIKDLAVAWIKKLTIKSGYPPDSYPNPALAFHNEQLQASAFHEQYDATEFEDLTLPKYDMIHKKVGGLLKEWKDALKNDDSANVVIAVKAGTKRKAEEPVDEAEIRSKYDDGTLSKLKVDQLKDFLRKKGLAVSGKKQDLIERIDEYFEKN